MKALPWILAGVAVGVCVTLLLKDAELETESATPGTEPASGSDAVEGVARKTYGWRTETLVGGKVG